MKVFVLDCSSPSQEGETIAFGKWTASNDDMDLAQARSETVPAWPGENEGVKRMADGFYSDARKGTVRILREVRDRSTERGLMAIGVSVLWMDLSTLRGIVLLTFFFRS